MSAPVAPRYWPAWFVVAFLRLCASLPLAISRTLGAAVGRMMYVLNRKRRGIALVNLKLCFPQLSPRQQAQLARAHFQLLGQSYIDLGFLAWASERRLRHKTRTTGSEHLDEQLARGRNIILLAPHCVGMNVGGLVVARHHGVFSMIKAQRNPVANWVLNKGRQRYDSPLLLRSDGLRAVVRHLEQGMIFYYLPDEDFGPRQSIFVPFFGVATATLTTLGRLARLADAAVIPCFTRLLPGGGGYEIVLKPALADFPSGDRRQDAARMNQVLETEVRAAPEQYMWTFKLFKTRPDNAASPYG